MGWGFNDKNYYSKIFAEIKQPETLVRKIGGQILDSNYHILAEKEAELLISSEVEVICKPTLETGSGRDIRFWKTDQCVSAIKEFLLDERQQDFIVQKVIKQHPALNKIHPSSINTIRICSLLMPDGVHILSSCLRMGIGDSRVDNASAGGIFCGIHDNGTLGRYAYSYYNGEKFAKHPQGLVFDSYRIPFFDKAIDLVKNAHPIIPHFRLVSWDIAIDEDGDALLIEPNMRKGGINLHQFSNGPLFGELTDAVAEEVFIKKRK